MKTSFLASGLLFICGVGCGDDGTGGEGGTASSSSSVTSTGSTKSATGSSGSNASSATSTASGSTTASTSNATSASASSGGGDSTIIVRLDAGDFFSNCMPAVPPDPLGGSFDVDYTSTGSDPGTVEVTGADIVYTEGIETLTWTFEAMPSVVSIDPNESDTLVFMKVAGSGAATAGQGGPCSFCGGGNATSSLTVRFVVNGTAEEQTIDLGQPGCAF